MEDFLFYFQWGWSHIISTEATDHLLFLLALTAVYLFHDRKKVILLITAFTIGHSLTLGLTLYDKIHFSSNWVEFLITVTIIITSALNFLYVTVEKSGEWKKYLMALFFGLVHGMGFAGTIRMTLAAQQQIAFPLFSFNVGIEAGQIVVVFLILLISQIAVHQLKLPQKWWIRVVSGFSLLAGMWFAFNRLP